MKSVTLFRWNAWRKAGGALAAISLGLIGAQSAEALPVFARQTGMACMACHTVYPELTHFGRMFKLNGYQLDNGKDVQSIDDSGKQNLALPAVPGLGLFVMAGDVQLAKPLPDSQIAGASSMSNGGIELPQQLSLLYGGKIAPHFGAFAQITYDFGSGTFNIDNTDFRFANTVVLPDKRSFTYGVSINNNPTVEDPWNTTPAFGFPYVPPEISVGSAASPLINSGEQERVAGPVGYVMWNEQLYAAFGMYRHAQNGADSSTSAGNPIIGTAGPLDSTSSSVIAGWNPYWRLAYEYDTGPWAIEAGTYGEHFKIYPGGGNALAGATNNYTDLAYDFQIQYQGEVHQMDLKSTYVHENQALHATGPDGLGTSQASDWLSYWATDFNYWYRRKYGATIGYISTQGSTDMGAYNPSGPYTSPNNPSLATGVVNSANGSPETNAVVAELMYVPWFNTKFVLQYTHYTKFNGATSNYDGVGRNASDNDTTYLLLWFAL